MIRQLAAGLTLAACFTGASALSAQSDLTLVGFMDSGLTDPHTVPALESRQIPPLQRPADPSFAAATVLSSLFAALGAYGGAYVGSGMNQSSEEYGGIITGVYVGAWLGGGLGGSLASGRPAQSFLGSAVGLLPATLMVFASEDGGRGTILLAPLAQGLVTAAFTRMR
jgi:hypothetical protein